jgi:hypothetical protein
LEINPYSPAVPVAADSHAPRPIVEPIHFDGLVHRSDIMALGRNERGTRVARALMFFGLTGFSMFIIMMLGLSWLSSTSGATIVPSMTIFFFSFIVFPVMILVPMWILSRFRGGYYAKRILKISPRIIGPLRGKIDNETLELRYMHYHSVTPIDSMTGVRLAPEAIGFTVDSRKLFVSVLPKHIFHADDFERVTARLEQLAIERPLVSAMTVAEDSRLISGQTLALIPQPEGGIAFDGTVLRSDLSRTPIYKRQIRKFFIANLILLLIAILLPVMMYWAFEDLDTWALIFLVSLISVPFLLVVVRGMIAYRQHRKMPDTEITKLAGWIAKDNVTLNSTIGSFAYLKNAFIAVESDDHSIQCLLSGQLKQVVLLPRHLFHSDDDYQAARNVLHGSSG